MRPSASKIAGRYLRMASLPKIPGVSTGHLKKLCDRYVRMITEGATDPYEGAG